MKVLIIGAGLAGLSAANYLHRGGAEIQILEAADRVGGRIKTDQIGGFLLDHGFQVFLTAYPEAKRLLDYEDLQLKKFLPGAAILRPNGRISEIGDPTRHPAMLWKTLFSHIGSLGDKLKMLSLKMKVQSKTIEHIFSEKEKTTMALLKELGFTSAMIGHFFLPFYRGIFLEEDLNTSRRMFEFVFKMFSEGFAAVPARGMQAIPQQLADRLPPSTVLLNEKVLRLDRNIATTANGQTFEADKIILATEATGLVKSYKSELNTRFNSTTCVYFSAPAPISNKPLVILNPNSGKLVNNLCVMSNLSNHYAPPGQHLVAVSVSGFQGMSDEDLAQQIVGELQKWYGEQPKSWKHLKTYRIRYALPNQESVENELEKEELKIGDGLYVAGDHLLNGSINAAMKTGRLVAERILEESV